MRAVRALLRTGITTTKRRPPPDGHGENDTRDGYPGFAGDEGDLSDLTRVIVGQSDEYPVI